MHLSITILQIILPFDNLKIHLPKWYNRANTGHTDQNELADDVHMQSMEFENGNQTTTNKDNTVSKLELLVVSFASTREILCYVLE